MRHASLLLLLPLSLIGCTTLPASQSAKDTPKIAPTAQRAEGEALQRSVRVEVVLDGKVITSGHGTFVRPGIVATAVHVVDHVPDFAELRVRNLAGQAVASPYVGGHREGLDGALLFVHEPAGMGAAASLPPLPICTQPIQSAQPVVVAIGNSAIRSHGSPDHLSPGAGTDHLTHDLPEGASGSGVFDAATGCLAGLVSQRRGLDVQVGDGAAKLHTTRLTTAAEIQVLIDRLPPRETP